VHPARRRLLWINVFGGVAVLGSYWYGFATTRDPGALWGGVPDWMRPAYAVSMLAAAAGYFPAFAFVLLRLDAERVRVGRQGYGVFSALYALMLVPSALWMPLTFRMLEAPSEGLWIVIRFVLCAVAVGSVGLLVAIVRAHPRPSTAIFRLAVAGQLAFCVQTAVLDPLVWPAYFPH